MKLKTLITTTIIPITASVSGVHAATLNNTVKIDFQPDQDSTIEGQFTYSPKLYAMDTRGFDFTKDLGFHKLTSFNADLNGDRWDLSKKFSYSDDFLFNPQTSRVTAANSLGRKDGWNFISYQTRSPSYQELTINTSSQYKLFDESLNYVETHNLKLEPVSTTVPEPSTWAATMVLGLGLFGFKLKKRITS